MNGISGSISKDGIVITTGDSGVRSSWLSTARNLSFALFAASAASRADRSAASTPRRSMARAAARVSASTTRRSRSVGSRHSR